MKSRITFRVLIALTLGIMFFARRSGGQVIANGRIPTQALLAALEADEMTEGG